MNEKPFHTPKRLSGGAVAAAARKDPPYIVIANTVTEGLLGWIEAQLKEGTQKTQQATAAMILAMIGGIALLETCTNGEKAILASVQLGTLIHPGFQ